MAATIQVSTQSTTPARMSFPVRQSSLVYWRRRFAAGAVLILIGAGLWTMATWATNSTLGVNPVTASSGTQTYVVQPGDTLWSVALRIDSDGDVRDTVDRLAKLNGGSAIAAGQRLLISG